MIPRRDFVDKWKHLESGAHDLAKKLTSKEAATTSGAWKILSSAAPENILFLSLTTKQQAVDQKLKNFFSKWRQVKEKLPFPEMAEMRITAQLPEYQKIMDEAFLLLLDGKLRSHNEIMNFLKPYEPPPPPPPPARDGDVAKLPPLLLRQPGQAHRAHPRRPQPAREDESRREHPLQRRRPPKPRLWRQRERNRLWQQRERNRPRVRRQRRRRSRRSRQKLPLLLRRLRL